MTSRHHAKIREAPGRVAVRGAGPLLVAGALALGACQSAKPTPAPTPVPQPTPLPPKVEQLVVEKKGLEEALAREQAARKSLEDQIAKSNVRGLEKDAQIRDLKERVAELQGKVDEAILEVVRAKGKLRSLESRAEAASNMAEAEIALKSLTGQVRGAEAEQGLAQADQMLKVSAEEFKKENYGGALYLANEAKSRLRSIEQRVAERSDTANAPTGESALAAPLPLQALKACNLREGPGTEFKVVGALAKGAKLVAYAQKGQWLRVKDENGTAGWVFQSLVAAR